VPLLRETHDERRKLLGDSHQDTLLCMHALARVWYRKGQIEDALEQYRRTHTVMEKVFGPDHPYTAWVEFGLKRCEASRAVCLREAKSGNAKGVLPETNEIAGNYYRYYDCVDGCMPSDVVDGKCRCCGSFC
jgi:hypothetical protein